MNKRVGTLFLLFFSSAYLCCIPVIAAENVPENTNIPPAQPAAVKPQTTPQPIKRNGEALKFNYAEIPIAGDKNFAVKTQTNTVERKPVETKPEEENKIKLINFLKPLSRDNEDKEIKIDKQIKQSEGIIYRESYKEVNAIDPQKQTSQDTYYPGLRGPNQLIIYTPAYGERTGTNEFGTEAIVENNMVIGLNGADSVIPKNGFVISGHGRSKTWIQKNIQAGSKVYIDYRNKSIRVFLTPESLIFAAKEKLKNVNGLIEYYKKEDILYNDKKAAENLENSKESLRKAEKKPEKTQEYITSAMESLDKAVKNAIPYRAEELKGIWIRPTEQSPEEIDRTVNKLHNSGITDIFLETYFHGKTIYPSKYLQSNGIVRQRSEFAGFDPLAAWINSAHKRNMKVHIWFETYYVGNENPQLSDYNVLKVYPAWANRRFSSYNSDTPVPSLSEHNGYFLDPANLNVKTYLLGIIKEIIDTYHPDGINLDYIRYPQTVDSTYSNYANSSWGYTPAARAEFQYKYGIDPINIKYGTPEWDMWCSYRQNKVTEFISEVSKLTRENNILLTAVIFPDLRKSKVTKMQNWQTWSYKNYVDGFTPLILTSDINTSVIFLEDIRNNIQPYTKIYPGLFVTFMGGTFDELLMQIQKTREYKASGTVLFDYAHFGNIYSDALITRIYNKSYDPKEPVMEQPAGQKTYTEHNNTNTIKRHKKKKLFRRRK